MERQTYIIRTIIYTASIILIGLSLTVTIPLIAITSRNNGGPWGFGLIGLPILIPLAFYLFFGFVGLIRHEQHQRKWFIIALVVTFLSGVVMLIILPVYPIALVFVPLVLSGLGMINRSGYWYYLIIMLLLGIAANVVLLKWEIDFDRSLPIIQLFS